MTKANQLRDALRKNKNVLPYADALAIIGTRSGMSHMLKTREIDVTMVDDDKCVTLDPDFKTKRALPIKRKSKRAKGSKKKHSKAPRKTRPFKAIADKLLKPSPDDGTAQFSLRDLAIDNLIASALNLAETLRREVEGVENNPNLIAAIDQQERATKIARAA